MLSRFLLKRLIAPLTAASIVCLVLAYSCPWQGFFVNLATTFIGILFTFVYVDTIVQRYERQQWAEAKERIAQRIEQLGFVTITNCRISFGYGTDIFAESSQDPDRVVEEMRPEMVRIAENILIPSALSKIEQFDQSRWKQFIERLQSVWQSADRYIELFSTETRSKGANYSSRYPRKVLVNTDILHNLARSFRCSKQ